MKRPSAWPLLVILLVVGVVFALLWFEQRLQERESALTHISQTLQERSLEVQALNQQLDQFRQQVDQLQSELEQAQASALEQQEQLNELANQVSALETAPTQTANPDTTLADTLLWSVSWLALLISTLEFILQ